MSQLPPSHLVLLIFCIRLFIALSTNGLFESDEYFQALEPAHRAVFGFGHLTWEWTATPPIRSFVFPALFVPAYSLVKAAGLENTRMLIWAPRIVQVIFATAGDVGLYQLAWSLGSEAHANVTLLLSLVSPYNTLALTRTLANSTETSLTIIALNYWPLSSHRTRSQIRTALCLAALCCMIRPTAAIIWCFLGVRLFWSLNSDWQSNRLLFDVALVGLIAMTMTTIIDTVYYGTPTFTPFLSLKTSLTSHIARRDTFYWTMNIGIFFIIGPVFPYALLGSSMPFNDYHRTHEIQAPQTRARSQLFWLVCWIDLVYSGISHEEWQFTHPVLPISLIFAAEYLVYAYKTFGTTSSHPSQSTTRPESKTSRLQISSKDLAYVLLTCLPLSLYYLRWYGSAELAVSDRIHDLGQNKTRVKSVGVLMPCHSIPWQSHIHLPHLDEHKLWALGCEPPLGLSKSERETYTSQTDVFFETLGPIGYLDWYFPPSVDPSFPPSPAPFTVPGGPPPKQGWNHTWPSHIVMFGALETVKSSDGITVKAKLEDLGYKTIWRARNGSGWKEDGRRRGGTVIWEWSG